ncbi:DUF2780 domain-containing protein [Marinobacter zhejiangensis]|uniref:DUF2780 domain-containing protein n=1 Tax=Marinobacter zhejiangensis TaxID=488535 RepID=A0A1I4L316_9GAMM|nr:DUF2780 domain-containing protein [Marinobacter zhejiangensis]SFL85430.1 Protein of unknown function VcgC/VcgE [Marinobacter zhejiangensis]
MSTILKRFLLVSSFYLLAPAANAFDLTNTLSAGAEALTPTAETSGQAQVLVGALQEQLGVTDSQAVGGTSALLQLAQNQLGDEAMAGLGQQVPGLDSLMGGGGMASSLLSGISSMDGVQQAFSALGLDSGMVQQFVPLVLGFLEQQGVGSELLSSLGGLWSPAA